MADAGRCCRPHLDGEELFMTAIFERPDADLRGREVLDRTGEPIGRVAQTYLDSATGRTDWALVVTVANGWARLVPLTSASRDGDRLRIPYARSDVSAAPRCGQGEAMTPGAEAALFRHYGLGYGWPGAAARGRTMPSQPRIQGLGRPALECRNGGAGAGPSGQAIHPIG
jgi:sporulation protein YlmC with PRC-barrel domain